MDKLPKIKFSAMTFEENIAVMAMFINGDNYQELKNNTNYFKRKYPVLENINFSNMNRLEIANILRDKIYDKWLIDTKDINNKIKEYQDSWDLINDDVMSDLSKRLNIKWPDDSLNINARVGITYAFPRYISDRTFDLGLGVSVEKAKEVAIHEICHFLYFEKWKELYNDYDETHYNRPNIIWYLSEAIIDPLLNNDVFSKYTDTELKSYNIFYNTDINGLSIIEHLRNNVNNYAIEEAIKRSYQLFLDNEELIKNKGTGF